MLGFVTASLEEQGGSDGVLMHSSLWTRGNHTANWRGLKIIPSRNASPDREIVVKKSAEKWGKTQQSSNDAPNDLQLNLTVLAMARWFWPSPWRHALNSKRPVNIC